MLQERPNCFGSKQSLYILNNNNYSGSQTFSSWKYVAKKLGNSDASLHNEKRAAKRYKKRHKMHWNNFFACILKERTILNFSTKHYFLHYLFKKNTVY